jgi:hypothetical protein
MGLKTALPEAGEASARAIKADISPAEALGERLRHAAEAAADVDMDSLVGLVGAVGGEEIQRMIVDTADVEAEII